MQDFEKNTTETEIKLMITFQNNLTQKQNVFGLW